MDHGPCGGMDHPAAQLDAVGGKLSLDIGVGPLEGHVAEAEKLHIEGQNDLSHLDGGMAGLGVYAAHMGHADGQIHIPHDLGVEDVRDLGKLLFPVGPPVIEGNILQGRGLGVGRGEPVGQGVKGDGNVLPEIDLLQAAFVVRHPPAALEGRQGLPGLDLIARKHPGVRSLLFLLQLPVEFPVDLLEGLLQARLLVLLEKEPLEGGKESQGKEGNRMGRIEEGLRPGGLFPDLVQSPCQALLCPLGEDQAAQDPRRHGVFHQVPELAVAVGILFLHGPFEHGHAPCILIFQPVCKALDLQIGRVLFQGGGHGFEGLALPGQDQGGLPVFVHLDFGQQIPHGDALKEGRAGANQLGFHGQGQAQGVGVAGRGGHVLQGVFHALLFALPALGAELPALLQELLQELIAVEGVPAALHGDQAVAHHQILIALVLNGLFQLVPVHLAGGGVRILSGPGMLAAVGDIFGRLIEHGKVLLAQLFIDLEEPGRIKAASAQLLGRQGRVSGDHRFLPVIEALIHMGHEVIAAGGKALQAKDRLDHFHPLGRVHGHFGQALPPDPVLLYRCLQVLCRLAGKAPADLQKVGETLLPAGPLAAVGIVGPPVQRIVPQGPEDLHEPGNAPDPCDAGHHR